MLFLTDLLYIDNILDKTFSEIFNGMYKITNVVY